MKVQGKKGFTLIEVLLTISIFSIVWIMFGNLLNTSFRVWSRESDYISRKQKGKVALERMIDHLKSARDISILGEENNQIQFKGYYKDEGLKWITYKLYSSGDCTALGIQVGEEKGQGTTMPIINDVSSLEFKDINEDLSLIKVTITIYKQKDKKRKFSSCVAPGGKGG